MDFEKIFRSPDIHPWHALLRRVRCRHAGPFTCPSRSGRPAKTCAITPPRPSCVNGRQRSCASRPACRPLSRRANACCVRAIRKPSLAGGIAGKPRVSRAAPSGTDAGARPLVPPDHHDPETAATEGEQLVRRDPRPCGRTQTRGTLDAIRSPLGWGRDAALRGIARIRDRLGITWPRARRHGPRPDPHYPANLQEIADVVADAPAPPNPVAPVDRDDVTVTRRPPLANGDGRAGADQVRAERRWATDGDRRSVGSLDVVPGQGGTRRATTMGRATRVRFSQDRHAASPEAECIDGILDTWPVHFHPDVLVARAPHTTRWALSRPGNGPATPRGRAVRRAGDVRRPIQLMPLPTDASWRRLIESSGGGGCGRRSPDCTAGRRIAIRCAAIWMPSSRRLQPARQSLYRMSVSDSGLFDHQPHGKRRIPDLILNLHEPDVKRRIPDLILNLHLWNSMTNSKRS